MLLMNIAWKHSLNMRVSLEREREREGGREEEREREKGRRESGYSFLYSKGKKFHNAAKEGLTFADEGESHKEQFEKLVEEYKPLTTWLKETALSDSVSIMDIHKK